VTLEGDIAQHYANLEEELRIRAGDTINDSAMVNQAPSFQNETRIKTAEQIQYLNSEEDRNTP
jgi:hypothetical protein